MDKDLKKLLKGCFWTVVVLFLLFVAFIVIAMKVNGWL